jgi:hypothetical protein
VLTVPQYLQGPVGILEGWAAQEEPAKFLVVQGVPGVGKRFWIDRVLEKERIRPVHFYTDAPVLGTDDNGRTLVPVYHFDKAGVPPVPRAIVILESTDPLPKTITGDRGELAIPAVFPAPPRYELERYLGTLGAPSKLVEGNPTFAACRQAAFAWKVAEVEIRQVSTDPENWEGFRRGGEPPVEGHLLGYYCGENLPPSYWTWNRALYFTYRGRVPASMADLALDEIRHVWPPGIPKFPQVLAGPKHRKEEGRRVPTARSFAPLPASERSTPIVWP